MGGAVVATIAFGLMLASWMSLGPSAVGGPVVYTIISGTSMNPLLHRGDVAVLRVGRDAQVGDVFAYRGLRGQTVLHRIIAEDPVGYTLKGDNNSWIDSTHPTNDDLIGKLWFHIPGGGDVLQWVRSPLHAAVIAGGVIAMVSLPGAPAPTSAPVRRLLRRRPTVPANRESWMLGAAGPSGDVLLGVLGGLVVLAAAVAAVMWLLVPGSHDVTTSKVYSQRAQFSYRADAVIPKEAAVPLPGGSDAPPVSVTTLLENADVRALVLVPVKTGEPIFVNVNPTLDMTLDYTFASSLDHNVSGTIQVDSVVGDITGWKRVYPWIPATPFTGDHASVSANTGDLRSFMNIFPIYEAISGHAPRYYTIALVATVKINGVLADHEFHDTLDPNLTFRMVPPYEIFVETPTTREFEVPGVPLPPDSPDPYVTERDGSLSDVETRPNAIPILGRSVPVLAIRVGAASVGLAALLGGVLVVVLRLQAHRRGEDFMIRARYALELVTVGQARDAVDLRHVQLTTMDDLVHLARLHGAPIFMETIEGGHRYFVVHEEWVYAHDVASMPGDRGVPDAA